tara:strand:+ start:207 stop:794 length:588 start_codon:yes stop_codon:yes gene_type:complete
MTIKKKYLFLVFFCILILLIFNFYNFKKKNIDKSIEPNQEKTEAVEEELDNSNKMDDVSYSSKDVKGNEYIINAKKAEIDFTNSNILFLTNVTAIIKLKNSSDIKITSNYGKYNSNNFDTIFSKNVIISYLDNKIKSEYLDFSLSRNSMIISKDVIFNNFENTLKADVIEMNIKTKDAKVFMYEKNKKVNIKNNN